MIEFFGSDSGLATIISALGTLAAVAIRHWLQGRVNLIAFSPSSTYFELKQEGASSGALHVRSGQVMIQNLGRLAAKNVQVIASDKFLPAGFNIVPAVDCRSSVTEQGQWMLDIPYIASKELVTIQILNGPNIESIRCTDGVAKFVPVIHQRIFPRWLNILTMSLMIIGLFAILYAFLSIVV